MKFYLEELNTVYSEVNSSEQGLSSAEAAKRLEANGKTVSSKKSSVRWRIP